MKQATESEKESKAVTTSRPAEIFPRARDFERWFDRFLEEFKRRPFPSFLPSERWWPFEAVGARIPIDVYEEQDDVVLKAELPGLSKEDINLRVMESSVTLDAEKKREEQIKESDYHRSERTFGTFSRTIDLPCEVKADLVKASFKNGVLEVRLPKTEEARKKQPITIKID